MLDGVLDLAEESHVCQNTKPTHYVVIYIGA